MRRPASTRSAACSTRRRRRSAAGFLRTLWEVILPIIAPSIVSVGVFFFVRSMVTLSAVIFLVTPATQVAAVSVLLLDDAGNANQAAAFSVCIMLVVAAGAAAVPAACCGSSGRKTRVADSLTGRRVPRDVTRRATADLRRCRRGHPRASAADTSE